MDWRASVYGSRSGDIGGYRSRGDFGGVDDAGGFDELADSDEYLDDDGVVYGGSAVVPDRELRVRGGSAYFRAYEVVEGGRLRDLTYTRDESGMMVLAGAVEAAGGLEDGYQVSVRIDEDARDMPDARCTCPAFGRNGSVCKHVIAMVMAYNESPQRFRAVGASVARPARERTSNALKAFMRREDVALQRKAQRRGIELLKEVDAAGARDGEDAGAGEVRSASAVADGSVRLRLGLDNAPDGWHVRLRATIPGRNISYAVKDIRSLVAAVGSQAYVSYGKRLAFVHERRSFDQRSQRMLDILDRAMRIRDMLSVNGSGYRHRRQRTAAGDMIMSEDEICDLLDLYAGADATLDYSSSQDYFAAAAPAGVLDGDPDLGISIERVAPAEGRGGFVIRHRLNVERFVSGHGSSFVIIRAQDAAKAAAADSLVIHRCSARMTRDRAVIRALCGAGESAGLFLSEEDLDEFSRTVLPSLLPSQLSPDSRSQSRPRVQPPLPADPASTDAGSGVMGGGIMAKLPEEMLRLRRPPCMVEIYLDRDRDGITCDVQARYDDVRFHVFDGRNVNADDADDGFDPALRDGDTERLAVEAVRHYFPLPTGAVARIPESDDEAIYTLLSQGLAVLRSLGEVFSTPSFDGLTPGIRTVVKLGLSVRSGLVEISPIADEIDPEDVAALLASYRARRRFHRLPNGAFVDLGRLDVSAIERVSADLGIRPAELLTGPVDVPESAAYYLDHEVDDAGKSASFTSYFKELQVADPNEYPVPDGLSGVLRAYQIEGFQWLNAMCDRGFGGILADEMGLGKTVQMLALLRARMGQARSVGPSLVVCPASLVYNWKAECGRFAPGLRVGVVAGGRQERHALLEQVQAGRMHAGESNDARSGGRTGRKAGEREQPKERLGGDPSEGGIGAQPEAYDLLITSYDLLRRDIEDYRDLELYALVLDEAQYIKNHATKSARAVHALGARHRFALTGTPIENRLSELWSIFDVLMPGILGSYAHFRERFEMPVLSGDEQAQARLQAFVGPFILRRRKAQVLDDLPEKIENVLTVDLQGEQRRLYAALEQRLRAALTRQKDVEYETGKILVLAQLTKLRQVCCDPRLLYADAKGGSAKLDAIDDLVISCRDAGRKMLIFSQFTSFLELIAARLRADGVPYDVITGATPKKQRLELVNRFNEDATPVFLISLKAGNTGLNLTGACVVVHADPWWNAAAQNQATDRAHRIGQTQDVNVYQIVAKDTIEERILTLQRTKTDLASRFVDSAAGNSMADLTRDDVLALLG